MANCNKLAYKLHTLTVMKRILIFTCLILTTAAALHAQSPHIVVFQSDFGIKDGAVAAMKGVAMKVDPGLKLFDLTHEIPAYNIWEAAYRLEQAAAYWPEGTVFVSVVDPGVGSSRKSVVLQTKSGHYFVSPDNGTLTLVAKKLGIRAMREIDETRNRLQHSEKSYTFHGRDVYAFTGARLASGRIQYAMVGPQLPDSVVSIPFQEAVRKGDRLLGNIPVLDVQYGNVWTNIPNTLLRQAGIRLNDRLEINIFKGDEKVYTGQLPYVSTFSAVKEGEGLCYLNSLLQLSVALNMDNFAGRHHIASGAEWKVEVRKM